MGWGDTAASATSGARNESQHTEISPGVFIFTEVVTTTTRAHRTRFNVFLVSAANSFVADLLAASLIR